jgi:hypothetical protein
MQKVVGSSPIIRSRIPAKEQVLFFTLTTMNKTLSPPRSSRSWFVFAWYQFAG